MKIYHNPRCSKSRQALSLLTEAGIQPEIILYLESPPTVTDITDLLEKLGFEDARDLMRRGEAIYKELDLKNVHGNSDLIIAMSENPKLIERPIVVKGKKAVLGRPPENVKDLI